MSGFMKCIHYCGLESYENDARMVSVKLWSETHYLILDHLPLNHIFISTQDFSCGERHELYLTAGMAFQTNVLSRLMHGSRWQHLFC